MAIALHNLKKTYVAPDGGAVPVIDVAEFAAGDGEQIALVGSSGSGKTTLLNLIAGILPPDAGQIRFSIAGEDTDLAALDEPARDAFRGRNVGFIFQTHHLLPGFTALENVLLGMSFTGRAPDAEWARYLLGAVGLAERLNYRPEKLSVGQQQRVAIARALANRPKLVLADEPTGSLDAVSAQQALDLIRRLSQEVNATLLLVSHDSQITSQFPRVVDLFDLNRAAKKVEFGTRSVEVQT